MRPEYWHTNYGQPGQLVHKYGRNADVDTATDPEDIWTPGGLYAFPSAAAATTIVSTDAADDGDPVGTGARTVTVEGLDSAWMFTTETATLNGVGAVSLATDYLRVFRAYVATAGSGETNAGTITVNHGATVLAQIEIGDGQTQMAVYTTPADFSYGALMDFYATLVKGAAGASVKMALRTRTDGGAWQVKESFGLQTDGMSAWQYVYPFALKVPPKTDIVVRCLETSANDADIAAGFDIVNIV